MQNLDQTIKSTNNYIKKFVEKRLDKVKILPVKKPKPVVCPFCFDFTNYDPPHATCYSLYIEIIKRAYLQDTKNSPPKKSKNCSHLMETNEWTNQNAIDLIQFFDRIIFQSCYFDLDNFNGKNWINVDSNNPSELIKLFSDIETMEFVILRYVDNAKEMLYSSCNFDEKEEARTDYFYSYLKHKHKPMKNLSQPTLKAIKYYRTEYYKLDFFKAFANKVLKIAGRDWLSSLDPAKYDYRLDFTKSCGRHLGNIHLVNTSEDPGLENIDYRYFLKWLENAEERLGKKFVKLNYEVKI